MTRLAKRLTVVLALALSAWAASAALAGDNPNRLRANLTGAAERPDPGDANGTGTAFVRLISRTEQVCFNITYQQIQRPVAGHIHRGGRQAAGPIVVPLFERAAGAPSPIRGCANDVSHDTIRQIRNRPGRFYVNLHNSRFPAGAIRGQLRQR
jgi:CHRD domain